MILDGLRGVVALDVVHHLNDAFSEYGGMVGGVLGATIAKRLSH